MAAASKRAGRDPGEVKLIAVTKTVGPAEVRELYDLGVRDFGENRVPDGTAQMQALGESGAVWHMIGHLQRNKAGQAVEGGFACVHSVESEKLIDVLERECAKSGKTLDILIEVNVSGEESKYGAHADLADELVKKVLTTEKLRLRGLMTMAPYSDDPEDARPHFRRLRELRDSCRSRFNIELPHLSMGMTGDFEVAIEEGATLVRIGTALFV
jgi:pyridoxal phosphate enzyme, YggS family